MRKNKYGIIVPVLMIALGVTWLLEAVHIAPRIDWLWTGGLAVCGVLILAVGGLNKMTIVLGPFLLAACACSILRQNGALPIHIEMPVLFIILGLLLLLAYLLPIPFPRFMQDDPPEKED